MPKDRWTIEKMKEYRDFCGWDTLKRLIEAVTPDLRGHSGEILIHNVLEQREGRAMIATTFETGARICEVIGQEKEGGVDGMKVSDFEFGENSVGVIFNIEKRYDKVDKITRYRATDNSKMRWDTEVEAKASGRPYEAYEGFTTKRKVDIRNITIPIWEPLVPIMRDWVEFIKMENEEGRRKDPHLFDLTYQRAYRIVTKAGEALGLDFPPHRLRAERATQIVLEYDIDDHKLTEWFNWRSPEMAYDYTSLARKTSDKMMKKSKELFG